MERYYLLKRYIMIDNERVTWPLMLKRSNFVQSKGVMYPEVMLRGTLTMEDIIDAIVSGRSELHRETFRMVAQRLEEAMQSFLVQGYAISTGLGTLTPAVTGPWDFRRIDPEARAKNKATIRYNVSKEMKEKLDNPLFRQVGFRRSRLYIDHVYNQYLPEAENVASPGDILKLVGNHLLMNGESPKRGIYFLKAETQEVAAFISPKEMIINGRTTTFLTVPGDLPTGDYLLKVVSQCTTNPKPLKVPGEYVRKTVLRVMPKEEALEAVRGQEEEG